MGPDETQQEGRGTGQGNAGERQDSDRGRGGVWSHEGVFAEVSGDAGGGREVQREQGRKQGEGEGKVMTALQVSRLREGDKVRMQLNAWTERTGTVVYRDGALRIAHDHSNQITAALSELDPKMLSRN